MSRITHKINVPTFGRERQAEDAIFGAVNCDANINFFY